MAVIPERGGDRGHNVHEGIAQLPAGTEQVSRITGKLAALRRSFHCDQDFHGIVYRRIDYPYGLAASILGHLRRDAPQQQCLDLAPAPPSNDYCPDSLCFRLIDYVQGRVKTVEFEPKLDVGFRKTRFGQLASRRPGERLAPLFPGLPKEACGSPRYPCTGPPATGWQSAEHNAGARSSNLPGL